MGNINELQAAASRFGSVAGFGAVVPTGTVDDQTMNAVVQSLTWIRDHVAGESDTASGLIGRITSQSVLSNAADGLTTYLNQIGDQAGVGGSSLDFAPSIPGIANLKQAWGKVPSWAKVLGVVGLGLGLFMLGRSMMKRQHAHALAGMDYQTMAGMFNWQ